MDCSFSDLEGSCRLQAIAEGAGFGMVQSVQSSRQLRRALSENWKEREEAEKSFEAGSGVQRQESKRVTFILKKTSRA